MTLILSYYYTQLEHLRFESNQVKRRWKCTEWKLHLRPSHLQEYMEHCSPWKSKQWSICSSMRLCPQEHALPPQLPSSYRSWKWGNPDSVHFSPLFLGKYLYSNALLLCICMCQISWLSKIGGDFIRRLETKSSNCQINITTNFPCYLYGTARAGNWNLATGSSELT